MLHFTFGLTLAVVGALFVLPIIHRYLIADVLRDRLYCIRNTLFDCIMDQGGQLTHPLHREMRKQINGLIYLADRIDFFMAVACVRNRGGMVLQEPNGSMLDEAPRIVALAVKEAQETVHATLKRFIFRSCLSGVLLRPGWELGRFLWTQWREAPPLLDARQILCALKSCAVAFGPLEEKQVLPGRSYDQAGLPILCEGKGRGHDDRTE